MSKSKKYIILELKVNWLLYFLFNRFRCVILLKAHYHDQKLNERAYNRVFLINALNDNKSRLLYKIKSIHQFGYWFYISLASLVFIESRSSGEFYNKRLPMIRISNKLTRSDIKSIDKLIDTGNLGYFWGFKAELSSHKIFVHGKYFNKISSESRKSLMHAFALYLAAKENSKDYWVEIYDRDTLAKIRKYTIPSGF